MAKSSAARAPFTVDQERDTIHRLAFPHPTFDTIQHIGVILTNVSTSFHIALLAGSQQLASKLDFGSTPEAPPGAVRRQLSTPTATAVDGATDRPKEESQRWLVRVSDRMIMLLSERPPGEPWFPPRHSPRMCYNSAWRYRTQMFKLSPTPQCVRFACPSCTIPDMKPRVASPSPLELLKLPRKYSRGRDEGW